MTKETLINNTLLILSKLPDSKVSEVADFTEYILKKYDEELLQKGIEKIVSESKIFTYLQDEDDIYMVRDLNEKYK